MARPEADLPDVPRDPAVAVGRLLTSPTPIVYVVEAFGGGVFDVVRALANAAVARGHACSIVYGRRPETPPTLDDFFDRRVRLVEVPGWGRRDLRTAAAGALRAAVSIRRELRRHDCGVLHLHSSLAGVVGRLIPVPDRWRLFYSPHAYAFLNEALPAGARVCATALERALARRGTTIAVSRAEGLAAARLGGGGRVVVVYNGVEVPPPSSSATSGPFTVMSIGRATFQRRADLVARVAANLRRELDCRFVWVGDGSYRSTLVEAGVAVEGWLRPDEARARLEAGHVVLHLAAFEGFPVATLEAMAAGRAVVASDLPPLREAVGDAGILVQDDVDAVAALRRLALDAALRDRLAGRARERVARLFSRSAMIDRTFATYGFAPPKTWRNGLSTATRGGSVAVS